ncbi:hypothetical protein D3C71_1232050 [compost metagenome]
MLHQAGHRPCDPGFRIRQRTRHSQHAAHRLDHVGLGRVAGHGQHVQDAVGQLLDAHVVNPAAGGVIVACAAKALPRFWLHACGPIEGSFAFLGLPHIHRRQGAQPFDDPDACTLQAPRPRHPAVQHRFGDRAFGLDHGTQLLGHLAVVGATVERLGVAPVQGRQQVHRHAACQARGA